VSDLEALVIRLIEIDDRRKAVVVATAHEDIAVGIDATLPIMAEYREVMAQLRALVAAGGEHDD
jgi:hypothetical protein